MEAILLADAGLSSDQAEAIEALVAAVVAARNVGSLSGSGAMEQFRGGLPQMGPEQRARAEAALAELETNSTQRSMAALEARYGAEAVRVVLTREAEVTAIWESLLGLSRP